ncbi:hypothetical protein CAEBREN_02393 [Caenorhabditis brenneri]|uniref:Uncharacterized protein n=1 Tax=Caenorhabditis brenneri TaxID=135651 RepID=G0ND33_CAEBE|nr:hypothetical protein CAEBREN_02393 [Caenorhabditis brenneri]
MLIIPCLRRANISPAWRFNASSRGSRASKFSIPYKKPRKGSLDRFENSLCCRFGYRQEASVETSSPGLSIEEVVALNENEYVAEFPSLTRMLKKEKTVGEEVSAAPQAARKRQRKPKRLVTLSDVFDSSDAQATQPSTSKTSSPRSGGYEMGHRTYRVTGKKQSAINPPQLRNRPKPSSTVHINSNAL